MAGADQRCLDIRIGRYHGIQVCGKSWIADKRKFGYIPSADVVKSIRSEVSNKSTINTQNTSIVSLVHLTISIY